MPLQTGWQREARRALSVTLRGPLFPLAAGDSGPLPFLAP